MVVTERDVVVEFVKEDDRGDQCKIKGVGSNRFGDFELFGHGKWLPEIGGNNTSSSKGEYQVELRKRYLPPPTPSPNKATTGTFHSIKILHICIEILLIVISLFSQ